MENIAPIIFFGAFAIMALVFTLITYYGAGRNYESFLNLISKDIIFESDELNCIKTRGFHSKSFNFNYTEYILNCVNNYENYLLQFRYAD